MTTLNISIKSAEEVGALTAKYATNAGLRQEALHNLGNLIQGVLGGAYDAVLAVSTSSANPVAASGTVTITHANVAANDTVTIGGLVLTAVASGATGPQFNIGADATADAVNLAAAVNANATLAPHVTASSAAGVVTVAAKSKGSIGNLVVMATSKGTAFAFVQLAGGAGGSEGTPVTYTR